MKKRPFQDNLILIICLATCLLRSQSSYSQTEHYLKNWNTAIITGPLSNDQIIQYYIQPQINFINNSYKFNSAFVYLGLGYATTPHITFWLMNGYDVIKRSNGAINHLDIIREEMEWSTNIATVKFRNRLRLEEVKDLSEPDWLLRIREKLTARIPLPHWKNHTLVLFDEFFLDLNRPSWISGNRFLDQNRAFIGIGSRLSKQVSFDIGYLNQYINRSIRQYNDVLYIAFNIRME